MHHLFDDEISNLERFLDFLSKGHTFISYSEATNRILRNEVDKPYLVFSSDDGLESNLTLAKVLSSYNAKACFFINPASVGLKNPAKIYEFCTKNLKSFTSRFLDWADIEAIQNQGHEIGSHTMEHINVAESSLDYFHCDLMESKRVLEAKCGEINHFAYPFGSKNHFNKEAYEAVFSSGYESCASAIRGCHTGGVINRDELLIKRDHMVFGWPYNHLLYFLNRSIVRSCKQDNLVPSSW